MRIGRGEYNGWIDISNHDDKNPIALELIMQERIFDLDGNIKDTIVPNKDFVISPSRILLYPQKKAVVQVIYKGKAKIDADRVYSLLVQEIALPEGKPNENEIRAGIEFKVNYNVSVLMEAGKSSDLKFVSSKALDSGMVELIMENKGKGRFSFQDKNLYIGKEKIIVYTGGKNAIMPGQQRRFVFKYPKTINAKDVKFAK